MAMQLDTFYCMAACKYYGAMHVIKFYASIYRIEYLDLGSFTSAIVLVFDSQFEVLHTLFIY